MRTHKERVASVKGFIGRNKVFTIITIIAVVWLLGNFIFSKVETNSNTTETPQSQNEVVEAEDIPKWQFYPLDFWILLIGGGFCTIMILREKKKAKEELQ